MRPRADEGLNAAEIAALFEGCGLFDELSERALGELVRRSRARRFARGELLERRGAEVKLVYTIHAGYVKAVSSSFGGRSFLAEVLGPGSWLGLEAVLRGARRYFDLEVAEDCLAVAVDRQALESAWTQCPEILARMSRRLMENFEVAIAQLEANAVLPADAAMAFGLVRLLRAHGAPREGGGLALPFRLTQEELGQLVGVTREAAGRVLRTWERQGWIDLAYARLAVLDPEKLETLVAPPRTQWPPAAHGMRRPREELA